LEKNGWWELSLAQEHPLGEVYGGHVAGRMGRTKRNGASTPAKAPGGLEETGEGFWVAVVHFCRRIEAPFFLEPKGETVVIF
jgi:hypothetical protein